MPYRKASLWALWGDKPEGLLPENCPNFFFFFCLGRDPLGRDPLGTCDKPQWGRENWSFLREIKKCPTTRPPFGQKIVPIFSFFFVWAGTLWALVTSPNGAGKTEVFSGKLKCSTARPPFGPFGVTNLKVCSQKIVPIFSFFLFGSGPFGHLWQAPMGPGKLKFSQGNKLKINILIYWIKTLCKGSCAINILFFFNLKQEDHSLLLVDSDYWINRYWVLIVVR
jgi:hypothetical protein